MAGCARELRKLKWKSYGMVIMAPRPKLVETERELSVTGYSKACTLLGTLLPRVGSRGQGA